MNCSPGSVTPKQQEEIVKDIRRGLVDIVIGTHRVIQKDVQFKDLGLAIIDEEQRFGVAHKERFKEMFHTVDVLNLSATPIPRDPQHGNERHPGYVGHRRGTPGPSPGTDLCAGI